MIKDRQMSKVLITGGTGFIGKRLCTKLIERGYEVVLLSRKANLSSSIPTYAWDYKKGFVDVRALDGIDSIIHLAGENIGEKRWTTRQKKVLLESRVVSAEVLFLKLKDQGIKLKTFISASAVGYYDMRPSSHFFTEEDKPSDDFLGQICQQWERAADWFQVISNRTVKLRTGLVLFPGEGVYEKITAPLRWGIGLILGSGKQYVSWIHLEDLCNIYIKALEDNRMEGVYNAVAPDSPTYRDLINLLVPQFGKLLFKLFIPSFLLKFFLGERANLLLCGNKISSTKLEKTGYNFKYPIF